MPIYAYRCAACGHARDMLQKISDPPLTVCSACGAPRFEKQVTAAGFQLKGSGWYATDFKTGAKPKSEGDKTGKPKPEGAGDAKPAAEPAAAPAPVPAPAAAAPPSAAGK